MGFRVESSNNNESIKRQVNFLEIQNSCTSVNAFKNFRKYNPQEYQNLLSEKMSVPKGNLMDIFYYSSDIGDLDLVKFCFKKIAPSDITEADDCKPVFLTAIKSGNVALVNFLLYLQKLDIKNEKDIKELKSLGMDDKVYLNLNPEYKNKRIWNSALRSGNIDIVKIIQKSDDVYEYQIPSLLMSAARSGNFKMFETFTHYISSSKKEPIDLGDEVIKNIILQAAKSGNFECFKGVCRCFGWKSEEQSLKTFLSSISHLLSPLDDKGRNISHMTAIGGNFDIWNELPQELKNDDQDLKKSPLFFAIKNGQLSFVKSLFSQPSNEHLPYTVEMIDALLIAVEQGQLEIVKFFLKEKKIPSNIVTPTNNNLLHFAANPPNFYVFKFVFERIPPRMRNEYLKTQDDEGFTPLDLAIRSGNVLTVKYLIEILHVNYSIEDALNLSKEMNNLFLYEYFSKKLSQINQLERLKSPTFAPKLFLNHQK